MIQVSKQVWSRWEKLSAQDNKPFISLLLVTQLASEDLMMLVEQAAADAEATLGHEWDRARPAGVNVDLGVGAVSSAPMPSGVVITIGGGAEQFEAQLRLLVEGLERRGVEGKLGVFRSPRTKALPLIAPLLECRLRVLGERYHLSGSHYRWRVDRGAWSAVIGAGVKWCREMAGQATMQVGLAPRAILGPDDDAARLLVDAAEGNEGEIADFASGGPDRWRLVAVEHYKRRIALIEVYEAIGERAWQVPVARMTAFLTDNHEMLLYAFVKHGTGLLPARDGYSLIVDWPQRPAFHAAFRWESEFEDSHAPDAFAVQLLGPRYAGRIPTGADWRQTRLAHDRVLIQHISPEKWFEGPFGPVGGRGDAHLDPPVVMARAREDFAGILFTDEFLREKSRSDIHDRDRRPRSD